jgi:hypothetical protein
MSANATVATTAVPAARDRERGHRSRVIAAYIFFATLITALTVYGFDYYILSAEQRPFSPKHAALRPGGFIGIKLGILGLAMFLVIFLYPLRKRWPWLMRKGLSRHWLDYHVVLGISAPFVIAFHSSFKFRGFAGLAFWLMFAVSLSGVVGRYLYAQIPRTLTTAELSRKELQELQQKLAGQLAQQRLVTEADLRGLLRLPSPEKVKQLSIVTALAYMLALDLGRILRVAQLRRRALTLGEQLATLGGLRSSGKRDLERAIALARDEAALAKRILFLSRSQQVFHLWHVVHKPFSWSFAILALIHIIVVINLGYRW